MPASKCEEMEETFVVSSEAGIENKVMRRQQHVDEIELKQAKAMDDICDRIGRRTSTVPGKVESLCRDRDAARFR
ncbi:MAG: hypothetical protein IT165_30535 [Bryobacterales bacterium]|nr:hypothetical protein [Bryobacterales bacterium]